MSPKANHTCTFCDIIHGAGEVSLCYEDAEALAFMDIQPVNAGHVLVVPRKHYETLADVPRQLAMHLFDISMRLADVVRQVTGCKDLNLVVNSGAEAGQDVFHYHVHVIPRRAGDGFDVPLPFEGSEMPDRTQLDAMAARIIASLRNPMPSSPRGPEGNSDRSRTASAAAPDDVSMVAKQEAQRSQTIERPVRIASYAETPSMQERGRGASADGAGNRPRRWQVPHEGAHGELRSDF